MKMRYLAALVLGLVLAGSAHADNSKGDPGSLDRLPVIESIPAGTFCNWKQSDPFVRGACNLAQRLGNSEQWVTSPGRVRVAFRFAISRAFLAPSIMRIELESSAKATLTRSALFAGPGDVVDLSAQEIAAIYEEFLKANLWSAPASSIGPECPGGALVVLDIAVAGRFKTMVSCAKEAKGMEFEMVVDEIMRDHLR